MTTRNPLVAIPLLIGLTSMACVLPQPVQAPDAPGGNLQSNPLAEGLTAAAIPASTQDGVVREEAITAPTSLPTPLAELDTHTAIQNYESFYVETKSNTTRYNLVGQTAIELDRYMRQLGPSDSAGQRWFALTRPVFDWSTPCACDESGCVTAVPTVFVVVDYTLPVWEPAPNVEPEVASRWAAFERAVEVHERGHGERAMECGRLLGETFVTLPPQSTCEDVKASMLEASNAVFTECRAVQALYESETNHGYTQGVVWPP